MGYDVEDLWKLVQLVGAESLSSTNNKVRWRFLICSYFIITVEILNLNPHELILTEL